MLQAGSVLQMLLHRCRLVAAPLERLGRIVGEGRIVKVIVAVSRRKPSTPRSSQNRAFRTASCTAAQ